MSARLTDPLVVTTRDAGSWWKRALDADGHGLYARADCTDVFPELKSIRELSVYGLTGMLDAMPVPAGPAVKPSELDRMRLRVDEVERAYTFDTASLQRRIDGLEQERHETNESLSLAAETLRENRDRIAELKAQREALAERLRAGQRWQRGRNPELVSENFVSQSELRSIFGIPLTPPWGDAITQRVAPTQASQVSRPSAEWVAEAFSPKPAEGEHYVAVHHDYRTPRDLPELGGQR